MTRYLVIGLDGAEPALVAPWMEEGRLPNLAAIRSRGNYLPLASTTPPATFPAWSTCVTGVNPGRHGLFDFTETVPGAYAIRFINSTFRKAPAIWQILSDAGKRVGVLGVPGTYPPEAVNGFMVSGFDSPVCTRVDGSFVYPKTLYPKVRGWRFADFQETAIGPGWHARALPKLLEGIAAKERIAAGLLAQEPWDFFMTVFGESDTAGHHFWLYHDQESPRHRPGFEDALLKVYMRLDEAVGALMRAAGEGVTVCVVSDHGMGGAGTGVVHLNNWLAEQGDMCFAPSRGGWLKQAALRLAPDTWKGALFRRFQGLAGRAESEARFGGIDWTRTRAWSEELNYFPSVRLNLKGREPDGQVDAADYDSYCADLCARLQAWGPVRKAWQRDELYAGDYVDRAPDIVLELALENGYSYSCLRSRGGPSERRIEPHEALGGKERGMNGNHRPEGVCLFSRPTTAGRASIQDIAPTILADMGVPAPPMDGRSLFGQNIIPSPAPSAPGDKAEYDSSEAASIEARLRDLGYYE